MGIAGLTKGRRVYVLGSENLKDCIRGSEAIITEDQPEDVVMGFYGNLILMISETRARRFFREQDF